MKRKKTVIFGGMILIIAVCTIGLFNANGKNISAKDIPSGSSVKVTEKDAFYEETPFCYPVVYKIRLIHSDK